MQAISVEAIREFSADGFISEVICIEQFGTSAQELLPGVAKGATCPLYG